MSALNSIGWFASRVDVDIAAEEIGLFGSGGVVERLNMPVHHQHIALRIAHVAEAEISAVAVELAAFQSESVLAIGVIGRTIRWLDINRLAGVDAPGPGVSGISVGISQPRAGIWSSLYPLGIQTKSNGNR